MPLIERTPEERAHKTKLRVAQLDEWIEEAHDYIAQCDVRIKKLGDVFQMMMVRVGPGGQCDVTPQCSGRDIRLRVAATRCCRE